MKYGALMAILGLVASCGGASHDEPPPPGPPPIDQTVFGPLVKQRDRVREQAETLPKERKENLDKAIEADEH